MFFEDFVKWGNLRNKGEKIKMGLELTPNLNKTIEKIINVEKNDTNNENANMSSMTPAGQMMKFASEVSKVYALENLISEKFRKAHEDGIIHIHDLDFYPSKTTTCLQYDLENMFEKGFVTKHGYIREAQSILTYATLATIIFQTNQSLEFQILYFFLLIFLHKYFLLFLCSLKYFQNHFVPIYNHFQKNSNLLLP